MDHLQGMSKHHKQDHNDDMPIKTLVLDDLTVFGFSADTLHERTQLASFYMFLDETVLVSFRFKNAHQQNRSFSTLAEFERERDNFLEAFAEHVVLCKQREAGRQQKRMK